MNTVNLKSNKPHLVEKNDVKKDILYYDCMLEIIILLLPSQIGGSNKTKDNILKTIDNYISGKCITEGYVKPKSIKIDKYSSGTVKGDKVEFTVVFQCKICNPVEGMWLNQCKVKSITKAGIHAEKYDEENNTPVVVFVIRDHFGENSAFQKIKEDDYIDVIVIGNRFELNDSCIEVIGELVNVNVNSHSKKI